jgi:hypothetical protein
MDRNTYRGVIIVLVCVLAALTGPGTSAQTAKVAGHPVIGLIDEVLEFYPDTRLDHPVKMLTVHAPRNSVAGVHVMITGLRGTESIRFSASGRGGKEVQGIRWYRMIDVPVAENSGLDRNTEKYSGMKNPYVIRRAPFRIYDPFRPVVSPVQAESTSVALRMEVQIDSTCPTGKYSHRISIACDGTTETLEFIVVVHRAGVPPNSRASLAYINWHSLDNICTSHGVEKWSEPFWAMLTKYAQLMARGRQNAFWFIWNEYFTFDSTGNVTTFRRDLLERYIRLFLKEGFTTIHGAPMVGRRDWLGSMDMLLGVRSADGKEVYAMSAKGKHMITEMATRIIAMMKENRWEGRWLQGVFDEPTEEYVDRYKELIALFRALHPGIQILEATLTTQVTGYVNVWCPQVHEYQANREFFDGRKQAGDRVWVYTCLAPGGQWMNRLLDMERLRQVYIGWACSKYDLQGYLHWGLNHHTSKPFEELVRYHMEGQYLPAGDSHIIYPITEGPLSSHRFEAHRIGMEDFELLAQVKAHDPKKAQEIIARVVQGFDKYSTDVDTYREARRALLEAADAYTAQ